MLLRSSMAMASFLLLSSALFTPTAHAFSAQPTTTNNPLQQQVIIIGAGVGGLATAARIKSTLPSTTNVLILEKNGRDQLGGRCGSFDVTVDTNGNGASFRHERGPSLLLLKEEYERLFEDCGKRTVVTSSTNNNDGSSSSSSITKQTATINRGAQNGAIVVACSGVCGGFSAGPRGL